MRGMGWGGMFLIRCAVLCAKTDEFFTKHDGFCIQMMDFSLNTMDFVFK